MKKMFIFSLLFLGSAAQAFSPCSPCAQANKFPDRFHFVKSYDHGAPVESVAAVCDFNDEKYVAIAGYNNFDCIYPASLRIYKIIESEGNRLDPMPVDIPLPSDYLYSVEGGVFSLGAVNEPYFIVSGCPDTDGNVVWAYALDSTQTVFFQAAAWGKGIVPTPSTIVSASLRTTFCQGIDIYPSLQLAVASAPVNGIARVYLVGIKIAGAFDVETQDVIEYPGGIVEQVAWLPIIEQTGNNCLCRTKCDYLTVVGKNLTGRDCKVANVLNYSVSCDGVVVEQVSTSGQDIIFLGPDYTVRKLAWDSECCGKYPYPFLLVIGDHPTDYGFESMVVVYYYIADTGEFKELAYAMLPGKLFAGAFTPGCDCKSVTVAGGCYDRSEPCTSNIWNLTYDCAPKYPTEMNIKAQTSFGKPDDVVTSLAFCSETICDSLIVATESMNYMSHTLDPLCPSKLSKGEIGVYKVFFCKPSVVQCLPTPICQRKLG